MLLATALLGKKRRASGVLKHLTDTLVGLCRALEVLVGADLLADLLTLSVVLDFVLSRSQIASLRKRGRLRCYIPALE